MGVRLACEGYISSAGFLNQDSSTNRWDCQELAVGTQLLGLLTTNCLERNRGPLNGHVGSRQDLLYCWADANPYNSA
jgi:hypothetical protein